MTTALPPGVGIGTITGWIEFAVQDGPDVDLDPEAEAVTGIITFTPTVDLLRGPSVLILARAISVPLVDGRFTVNLVATDDPDVVPHLAPTEPWFYTVTFAVPGAALSTTQISVLEGVTQDLVALL